MAKLEERKNQTADQTAQSADASNETNEIPERDQWADWREYRKWRRSDYGASRLFWAAILIGAGVLFLINDFGHTPYYVWDNLIRLWPLLFVFVGLRMLIGRGRAAAWIMTVAWILVIIGFLVYATGVTFPEVARYLHHSIPFIPNRF